MADLRRHPSSNFVLRLLLRFRGARCTSPHVCSRKSAQKHQRADQIQ